MVDLCYLLLRRSTIVQIDLRLHRRHRRITTLIIFQNILVAKHVFVQRLFGNNIDGNNAMTLLLSNDIFLFNLGASLSQITSSSTLVTKLLVVIIMPLASWIDTPAGPMDTPRLERRQRQTLCFSTVCGCF